MLLLLLFPETAEVAEERNKNQESSESPENQYETIAALRPHEIIVSLACGGAHTICITSFGRVFSFGLNRTGQCGVSIDHGGGK